MWSQCLTREREFEGKGRTAFTDHVFPEDALGAETGIPATFEVMPSLSALLGPLEGPPFPCRWASWPVVMAGASN